MDTYQSAKEEIKRTADIAELIGQYVQLKKAGQNHIGLCPFHGEKDPSFTVSQAKQMFHCFGCKKGGDIFAFWMEYHKVSFPQAMKDLAQKYHISLPERELSPSQRRKVELRELLFEINKMAAEYYNHILTITDKGKPGLEYLKKRSFHDDIIKEFMLGYAPSEWGDLTSFLRRKKIDMNKAVQAGLIIPSKNKGYYDRFRGRIMFPICNLRKQVAGFGGRVLDESLPKYINSPETNIFHKGELLYGLDSSYQAIRENSRAVIVEGYTDVLALKSYGIKEAVATLGTALTKDHLKKLKGYAKEAVVVFDSDTAGKGAVIRSLPLFLNEGLSAKVMILPEGSDPDSFINEKGLKAFRKLLNDSVPMFEYYLDLKTSQENRGVEGQVELLKEILPVLSDLNSDSQRSLYIGRLSERSGITESIILTELRKLQKPIKEEERLEKLRKHLTGFKMEKSPEKDLLNLIVHYPHAMDRLIKSDYSILLSDPVIIEIFRYMDHTFKKEGILKSDEIVERLNGEPAREKFREVMLSTPICPEDTLEQAVDEFINKISKVKLTRSFNKTKGNIEESNRLLMAKKNRSI